MNAVEQLCRACMRLDHGRILIFSDQIRQVITSYLLESENGQQASKWHSTGNEHINQWFKPLSIGIVDSIGFEKAMPIKNNEEVWIQIEGEIYDLDHALTIGYAIYAEDGSLLYWSYHTDGSETSWPRLDKGRFVLRSLFPERLLNEGNYVVELIASLHFREWLFQPGVDSPSINISIQGGLSDSPLWIMKRPGLIAPVLEWKRIE